MNAWSTLIWIKLSRNGGVPPLKFSPKMEKGIIKIEYPKGDPENPLSWEEMVEKFYSLTGRLMGRERRLKIVDQVRSLETIRDLKKWSPLLLRDR